MEISPTILNVVTIVLVLFGIATTSRSMFMARKKEKFQAQEALISKLKEDDRSVVSDEKVASKKNLTLAGEFRNMIFDAVVAGQITAQEAAKLAYALAGERYENAPAPADESPTGTEPANEFIHEFVRLATSKNEKERKAAALDLEGRTEEALALLGELAEEETALAAARWKARGAMAFNAFTAKAIDSYERAIGCNPDDAEAHNQLGLLYKRTGDLDRAKTAYEKVLSLGNQQAEKYLIAVAYGNLGLVEQTRGNLDAADAYYQKSLALDEALGRKEGMADSYANLGLIERARGNLDAAETYQKKALGIEEALDRKEGMATTYGNLGLIEQTRGNLDAAEAYTKKSQALNETLGGKEGMADQYGNLGVIEQTRSNLDAAEAYFKKSLALNEALGRKEGMATTYGNLGNVEKDRGNIAGAVDYWREALALFQEIGMPHMVEKVQGAIDKVDGDT